MNKISIVLIDDHDIVRTGIRRMLELEDDFSVLGEASRFEEAFSMLDETMPSIILMDIKMPGMDGVELTRRVKQKYPQCKVIMFTLHGDYLNQAIEAGASGYLLKDIRRGELAESIRRVHNGEQVISGDINRIL